MRILAGGPAAEVESEHFKASKEALQNQRGDFEVDVKYIVDRDPSDFEVTEDNHVWSDDAIHRVGRMRQDFLDMAEAEGYDAAWLVDTDVIVGPDTLRYMNDVQAPIVFGVFWTIWKGEKGPLPQVWDVHPYSYQTTDHEGKTLAPTIEALKRGMEIQVNGGGACTLIRNEAFGKALYHPPLDGMPWWGEDRDFCTRAQCHDLMMVATPKPKIVHLYTPEQRAPEVIAEAKEITGWTP